MILATLPWAKTGGIVVYRSERSGWMARIHGGWRKRNGVVLSSFCILFELSRLACSFEATSLWHTHAGAKSVKKILHEYVASWSDFFGGIHCQKM